MIEFWLALAVFFLSHSLISRGKIRPFLVSKLGRPGYLFAYSLLSLALLTWLISAAVTAPRLSLWPFVPAMYWIPNLIMPLALMFLLAGFIVPNPLSIAPRETGFDPDRPPFFVAATRHPVLWGFALWAGSHIPPNGEYPILVMFALFALFSLLGLKLVDRKRRRALGEKEWRELARKAPLLLFASRPFWQGKWRFTRLDLYAALAGLIAWAALYHLHGIWFGIVPIPPLP